MRVGVETFADPNQFAAMLHPSVVEVMPLARGRFTAESAVVELPRTRLRRLSESLPRLAHVQHPPDRTYFAFLADESLSPVVVDGISITADRVLQFGSGPNSHQHSLGPTQWANISLGRAGLDATSRDIAEQDHAACGTSRVVIPDKSAMWRLRRLHAEVVALAVHPSTSPAEPELARSMENQLLEAMVDCCAGPEQRLLTSVEARHAAVAARFRDLLEANRDRALYLPEVCTALGVSHRTLSYCCNENLGMSPKRYFYLRRMHLVRRALQQTDHHATTVTEIATAHGIWEFGRFAVQYRALFGETPSATLRKESGSSKR
jgi:AraC-like DNA-binding protein